MDPVLKELVTKYPIGSTISGSTDSLVSWESTSAERADGTASPAYVPNRSMIDLRAYPTCRSRQ